MLDLFENKFEFLNEGINLMWFHRFEKFNYNPDN